VKSILESSIPGGWREEEVRIEDYVFQLLKPANPDEFLSLLDPVSGEPLDGIEPYWATVWQATPPMSKFIRNRKWPSGGRALELGAGIGVVGLVALARGLQVTFSDYSPLAVALAVENAHRNGFPHAQGLVLDWREPQSDQFSILLGADILYDWKNHEPILDVLDSMLEPDGECWIGDPGRFHTFGFTTKGRSRGYNVSFSDEMGNVCAEPPANTFRMICLKRACHTKLDA